MKYSIATNFMVVWYVWYVCIWLYGMHGMVCMYMVVWYAWYGKHNMVIGYMYGCMVRMYMVVNFSCAFTDIHNLPS